MTNLNELASNFSLADLVARQGNGRLLVQVRGTTTRHRWFQFPSKKAGAFARLVDNMEKVGAFARLADDLGHHAIYAFVHIDGTLPTIRFGTADHVEDLIWNNFRFGMYGGLSLEEPGLVGAHGIGKLLTEDWDD